MKAECLCVLIVLLAASAAADVEIRGVLSTGDHAAQIDSVGFQLTAMEIFPTPGWNGDTSELDTFGFQPVPFWPALAVAFGSVDGEPVMVACMPFLPDSWYIVGGTPEETRLCFLEIAGIEESSCLPAGTFDVRPSVIDQQATFSLRLPGPGAATLEVSDAAGNLVRRFDLAAGTAALNWDGTDAAGHRLAEGAYFCRLTVGNISTTRKVLLTR